jgi:hypothetical protein
MSGEGKRKKMGKCANGREKGCKEVRIKEKKGGRIEGLKKIVR